MLVRTNCRLEKINAILRLMKNGNHRASRTVVTCLMYLHHYQPTWSACAKGTGNKDCLKAGAQEQSLRKLVAGFHKPVLRKQKTIHIIIFLSVILENEAFFYLLGAYWTSRRSWKSCKYRHFIYLVFFGIFLIVLKLFSFLILACE